MRATPIPSLVTSRPLTRLNSNAEMPVVLDIATAFIRSSCHLSSVRMFTRIAPDILALVWDRDERAAFAAFAVCEATRPAFSKGESFVPRPVGAKIAGSFKQTG